MYWSEPAEETPIEITPLTRVTVALLALGIVVFGIFPRPILDTLKGLPPAPQAVAQK
jgi:NADH-quinone oxidoreductase subunit N